MSRFAGVSAAGARRRNPERCVRGISAAENFKADVAQLVEHSLGKGEVISSILIIGSIGLVLCRDVACYVSGVAGTLQARRSKLRLYRSGTKAGVTQW